MRHAWWRTGNARPGEDESGGCERVCALVCVCVCVGIVDCFPRKVKPMKSSFTHMLGLTTLLILPAKTHFELIAFSLTFVIQPLIKINHFEMYEIVREV